MTTSNTVTKTDLENIINAIFPATTEDMTQAQIDAFVASLACHGQGKPTGYGTAVNITSYNSNTNMYTCPSDGIVKCEGNYRSTSYMQIFNEDGVCILEAVSNGTNNNAGTSITSMPVYAGMELYCVQSSNNYNYAYFVPYTYD